MSNHEIYKICPAQQAWDVVSGKWKPCIIHVLSQSTLRFNELRRSVPGISQRMLTRQLRELERDGIVARHHYAEIPARVEYELTPLGFTILPVFLGLTDWWKANQSKVDSARNRYDD